MSNYSSQDEEEDEKRKAASKQAEQGLQNLFRTKQQSLRKYLEELFKRQEQLILEEESIIK